MGGKVSYFQLQAQVCLGELRPNNDFNEKIRGYVNTGSGKTPTKKRKFCN